MRLLPETRGKNSFHEAGFAGRGLASAAFRPASASASPHRQTARQGNFMPQALLFPACLALASIIADRNRLGSRSRLSSPSALFRDFVGAFVRMTYSIPLGKHRLGCPPQFSALFGSFAQQSAHHPHLGDEISTAQISHFSPLPAFHAPNCQPARIFLGPPEVFFKTRSMRCPTRGTTRFAARFPSPPVAHFAHFAHFFRVLPGVSASMPAIPPRETKPCPPFPIAAQSLPVQPTPTSSIY
jgi:hypothetical protein